MNLSTVADAYEFVPATFDGYFRKNYSRLGAQILNTAHVVETWKKTWKEGALSLPFYLYVIFDLLTSSLGSAVIIILITDNLAQAMQISPWISILLNVALLLFFAISCVKKDQNFQVSLVTKENDSCSTLGLKRILNNWIKGSSTVRKK